MRLIIKHWLCFVLSIIAIKNGIVFSLYDDQIGKFDWRLQFIGKPIRVIFDNEQSVQPRRAFVATDQNVVAAVNVLTGDIVWRQVLEQNDTGRPYDLLATADGDIITLTGGGQIVTSLERHRGTARFTTMVNQPENCESKSKILAMKNGHIAALLCNTVSTIDRHGAVQWSVSPKKERIENVRFNEMVAVDNEFYILEGSDSPLNSLSISTVSKTGVGNLSTSLNVNFDESRCITVSDPPRLVCFNSATETLHILRLSPAIFTKIDPLILSVKDISNTAAVRLQRLSEKHFMLTDGKSVWTTFGQDSDTQLIRFDGVTLGFFRNSDTYIAYAAASARGGFSVHIYDTQNQKIVPEWDIAISANEILSAPESIHPFFITKGDKNVPAALIVGADHSFALIQHPGKIVWNRQEALASILSVEMLDLPLSEAQANIEEEFSSNGTILSTFIRRITSQAVQLQRGLLQSINDIFGLAELIGKSESFVAPFMAGARDKQISERAGKSERLERDYFNLHKIIVVSTEAGKLFGLDSRRGAIVWQKYLPDVKPFSTLNRPVSPLFTVCTTAHYPHPAQCVVVGQDKNSANGVLVTFNPISGTDFHIISLPTPAKQAFILPVVDDSESQAIGIVSSDMKTYVYPSTVNRKLRDTFEKKPFVLFLAEQTGSLNGYLMDHKSASESADGRFLKLALQPTWKTSLTSEKQGKLISATMKRVTEQVHSQGRVLGDRSVLYKYVNPNLVAVMVESLDTTGKGQLNVYLLDAVTGDISFNAVHRRVTGPYHLIHCENWIVYTYWNEKARRNEVAVLELYEGKEQANPSQFSSMTPPPPPIVMRQAYVFPQGISAVGVTDTEKGITSRHLLIAMPFGGVLELSKAFFDPRRVLNPTMEQREEGLYPYIPDLPIVTEQIINYNQTLLNVRGIHASPSGLESTSLVLVYGLDLYFTRVTPSGTFDILKDDFDYWLIACVLVGLFVASAVTKRLARHREVKQAWR